MRNRLFYRGQRRSGWILTVFFMAAAILLAWLVWQFFDLESNMVYEKDRLMMVQAEEPEEAENRTNVIRSLELLDNVQIVVDKTDYSTVETGAGKNLSSIHAKLVPAELVTPAVLDACVTSMGSYDALILELKPSSGFLAYSSNLAMTDSYEVNGTLDIRNYISRLKENNVWLVAQLSSVVDWALAIRYRPISMKSATTGDVYVSNGLGWLDPYNDVTRNYLAGLMTELKTMGFDEILLSGLWLPADILRYSGQMTVTPDSQSAISSFSLYLRNVAETLELRLSAYAEAEGLRAGTSTMMGQDLPIFFRIFDRVAFVDDFYNSNYTNAAMEAVAREDTSEARLLPVGDGYIPVNGSYAVQMLPE